ncbi:MAG: glycosyltransferase family 1 protein [Chlorobium sp.]|nr:MAG: glycosyltransferase family 1 protein [Chlorobium sp.]
MKIALYAGTYVKDKDGAVKSIYQLVASFRKNGHEVAVWSPDVSARDNHNGLSVHTMPSVPIPLYPDYKLGFFTGETRQQLEAFAPDLVHISTPDIIGRKFLLYARGNNIPVASAFHTDFPSYLSYYHLGFALKPAWKYLTWFYNNCNVVLAPNESVRVKLSGYNIRNIDIWSRGIDKELFDPSRRSETIRSSWNVGGRTVVVYAGRFVLYKDIEVVMRVYDRFMQGPYADKVRFVMIGSGPEEEEMKRRMPEAVFTGYLTGVELPVAYACGDIFLFPSTTEAFCNVALEALASGLPAIVSDAGGCREIVNRSGGGLVASEGNVGDFYRKCLELLGDSPRYRELKARGLAFAEAQSWSAVNGALIDRYQKMVNLAKGHVGMRELLAVSAHKTD